MYSTLVHQKKKVWLITKMDFSSNPGYIETPFSKYELKLLTGTILCTLNIAKQMK